MNQVFENYKGLPFVWGNSDTSIYVKLDSRNRIFNIEVLTPKEQDDCFKLIRSKVKDLDIDTLKDRMMAEIFPEKYEYFFEKSLFEFREAIVFLTGGRQYSSVDSEAIMCRCSGIDFTKFSDLFHTYKGDFTVCVKDSNISMGCGGCKDLCQKTWSSFLDESQYLFGMEQTDFYYYISHELKKFCDYTHLELSQSNISLLRVEKESAVFGVSNFNRDESASLVNALENYFLGQLKLNFRVSLTLL